MKTHTLQSVLWLVIAGLMLSCSSEKAHAASKTGNPAAELAQFGFYVYKEPTDIGDFTVTSLSGETISSKDFKGKITMLNFWATWCPPCRAEMPSIERLYAATKGTKFQIVAVNAAERRSQVSDFIGKNKYTFPIYIDENGSLTGAFAARALPTTYFINKEGKFIAYRAGALEYDHPKLIALLKELADE